MTAGRSETPLARVRGLGAAGHQGGHWIEERFVSLALIPLSLWFIFSLAMLPALDRGTLVEWLRAPAAAVPMALFIIASFKHSIDGVKVWIDDYVHDEGHRLGAHYAVAMAAYVGGALSLFALAKIAFGAPAA